MMRILALATMACAVACSTPPATPAAATAGDPYADLKPEDGRGAGKPLDEPIDLALALTQADANTRLPATIQAAVRKDGPWSGKLLVLWTEIGVAPAQYREILREWARMGHHALALPLGLDKPLAKVCEGQPANCFENARWELHDGSDRTDAIKVAYADSATNRLGLVALALGKSGQGWGQFSDNGKPVWPKVIVAGHGDGAGQAAFVGTQLTVARVVLLAGPTDGVAGKAAPWMSASHKTAHAQWYAFGHTEDPGWPAVSATWTALGFGPGKSAWPSVDQGAVMGVQAYTTALSHADPHAAVATDAGPVDTQGKPRYRATWRNLAGP